MPAQQSPLSPAEAAIQAAPFLKWAGGKRQLLEQYQPLFPTERPANYFEPFVGSGAVFFHLRGQDCADRYHLSDANAELINVYEAVQGELEALIERLAEHARQHNRDHYYRVRSLDRLGLPPEQYTPLVRAARMIYLNKTCYNGLWRVNSKGHFNVPMGRYRNPAILDEARLRAASAALSGVTLAVRDFREVATVAQAGDFVYFDPPYVPLSETANFTSYSRQDFGEAEQRALAETCRALDKKGCRVMLSNSSAPLVYELYGRPPFSITTVRARRAINTDAGKRGVVDEIVARNYGSS